MVKKTRREILQTAANAAVAGFAYTALAGFTGARATGKAAKNGGYNQLSRLDATAQAELVKKGEISPLELVDAAIERIERLNPTINAIITKVYDQAREQAKSANLPKGPFAGVPFALKDLGDHQKGVPQTLGNKALQAIRYTPDSDSVLGARFREAGLIILGTTHTLEFGMEATNVQPHGPCRNPWNLRRSVAGSSSGAAAAAVASGMLPIAHGNDGGGSIRMPAAWCGLVGLNTLERAYASRD